MQYIHSFTQTVLVQVYNEKNLEILSIYLKFICQSPQKLKKTFFLNLMTHDCITTFEEQFFHLTYMYSKKEMKYYISNVN